MIAPTLPRNESDRLRAVQSLNILDTPTEERFDTITRAAAQTLHVPICTISIIDTNREWFKSCIGTTTNAGPRDISFCGHTIVSGKILIIDDASVDPRFSDNPQVVKSPFVRFYAGVTLHDHRTHLPIGAFCIKDTKPRSLSLSELNSLLEFADRAEYELNQGWTIPTNAESASSSSTPTSVVSMWTEEYGSQLGYCT